MKARCRASCRRSPERLSSARIGFDVLELHSAHGYLMSSFLSPLANKRKDQYGGSQENRMRFPLAIAQASRDAWPKDRAFGVRINGTDWVEGGITIEEAVEYSKRLRDIGCDFIDVSSGSNAIAEGCRQAPAIRCR